MSGSEGRGRSSSRPQRRQNSEMREIMSERGDFLLAQRIGDISHRGDAATDPQSRFVIMQRLQKIFLALAGEAGNSLGAGEAVGMACRAAASPCCFRALLRQ